MPRNTIVTDAILATRALERRFEGLVAVDSVTLECHVGQLHAVIGPNGAGKSTLVNLLSGDLKPSAGQVFLRGHEITGLSSHQIARRGIGRSYQKTNVFLPLTAFENCRLAAQSRQSSSMRFFRPAADYRQPAEAAQQALAQVGLTHRMQVPVSKLSHGEQRQVEIAMTLATNPAVLLLDEPLAGMGADESIQIIEMLKNLAMTHAVLLVEHDMDAVFTLAHTLTVMVNGAVLESGPPQQVRASRAVQQAYLGSPDATQ